MIDVHTHILPGLDDGSDSMSDSIEMARIAAADGTDRIIATTHSNLDDSEGYEHRDAIYRETEELNRELELERIPVKIFPGMEIFASEDIQEKIRNRILIGLNDSRYYLVEFPFDAAPQYMEFIFSEMLEIEGLVPVIAHPERYFFVQRHPERVYDWVQMGCLPQINRAGLSGKFGPEAQEVCMALTEHNLVAFVASDAHTPEYRTPRLGEAWEILSSQYNAFYASLLLEKNPERVVKNLPLEMRGPARRFAQHDF